MIPGDPRSETYMITRSGDREGQKGRSTGWSYGDGPGVNPSSHDITFNLSIHYLFANAPQPTMATLEKQHSQSGPAQSQSKSWLPIPEPVKKLFDSFPVVTYPAQQLPAGCPRNEKLPTLWIFTKGDGLDANGRELMSFNPSCLKWQV